jgi:hypothetical protein
LVEGHVSCLKVASSIRDDVIGFSIYLILPAVLGRGVGPDSNTNEHQESSWVGKARPALEADNLTAICEPIVQKMWDPRHLTTL